MSTRIATTAALILALCTASAAQVTKREYPGIKNFSRVNATVACGGATSPEAVQALKKEGFVSIVNLRTAEEPEANVDVEAAAAATAGIRYFHLPFKSTAPDTAVVDRFLTVVSEPKNQPVFIHCASANRVAALWLIKRVRVDKWKVENAMEEAKAIGLTSEPLRAFALDYLSRK